MLIIHMLFYMLSKSAFIFTNESNIFITLFNVFIFFMRFLSLSKYYSPPLSLSLIHTRTQSAASCFSFAKRLFN